MRFTKYLYGPDGKVRLCECGEPAVNRNSAHKNRCERCLVLERDMELMNRTLATVGFTAQEDLRYQLPQYHAIEPPIAGASLQVLNSMLARI